MNKKLVFFVACVSVFFLSCNNGYKVDVSTFRAVASFSLPQNDSPTGTAVFNAALTTQSVPAENFETIDEQTRFITLVNPGEETTLMLNLALSDLQAVEFGNVKVTAAYTAVDASSTGLVKEVLFDSYGLMVFAPPNRLLQYDPSKSTVKVMLNTAAKDQLGILSFKFEYAQSVYSPSCIKELNVFIATSSVASSSILYNRIREKEDNVKFAITNKYQDFSGIFTDLSRAELAEPVTIPLVLELLNVPAETPLSMRIDSASNIQITDVNSAIEGKKGLISFNLILPPGTYDASGISSSCTLVVESSAGSAGLPLTVKLNTLRKPNKGTKKIDVTFTAGTDELTTSGTTYTYFDKVKNTVVADLPLDFTATVTNLDADPVQVTVKSDGALIFQSINTQVLEAAANIPVAVTMPALANPNEEKTGTITVEFSDYSPLLYDVENSVKSVTYTITRKVPPAPDLQGIFATAENASPWRWRVYYKKKYGLKGNKGTDDALSSSGGQNSGVDLITSGISAGWGTKKQELTKTENNTARFLPKTGEKSGDVLASAGWLFSDIFATGAGFEYRLNATINADTASVTDKDTDGDRIRLYLVPLTNTANDFTLADAGGNVTITVSERTPALAHGNSGNSVYFEFPVGTTNFEAVFSVDNPTKMRVVIEKGIMGTAHNSGTSMASQSVTVSNVALSYN